jgi:hypothetical protein
MSTTLVAQRSATTPWSWFFSIWSALPLGRPTLSGYVNSRRVPPHVDRAGAFGFPTKLEGTEEAIGLPHEHGVEAAPLGVDQECIQPGTTVSRAVDPLVDVRPRAQPPPPLDELRRLVVLEVDVLLGARAPQVTRHTEGAVRLHAGITTPARRPSPRCAVTLRFWWSRVGLRYPTKHPVKHWTCATLYGTPHATPKRESWTPMVSRRGTARRRSLLTAPYAARPSDA